MKYKKKQEKLTNKQKQAIKTNNYSLKINLEKAVFEKTN